MNFPDKMYFLSAHFRQLAGEDVSNKPINWCVAAERKFVQAEEPTSYWELTLTDGSLCWQVMRIGLSSGVEPYLRIKGSTLKECLTTVASSGGQFFEIDMSWLDTIAGFISRLEKDGTRLMMVYEERKNFINDYLVTVSAQFNGMPVLYVQKSSLLQQGVPTPDHLWEHTFKQLAAHFPISAN